MKRKKAIIAALGIFALIASISASAGSLADDIVKPMVNAICKIYCVLYTIAGAVAALVITIAGFKWTGSAEDPGVRKQAKDTIIHALIGMLIIVIAVNLVELITGIKDACTCQGLGG